MKIGVKSCGSVKNSNGDMVDLLFQRFRLLHTQKKKQKQKQKVKTVDVFEKIWTTAILMRKDVQNPELVW